MSAMDLKSVFVTVMLFSTACILLLAVYTNRTVVYVPTLKCNSEDHLDNSQNPNRLSTGTQHAKRILAHTTIYGDTFNLSVWRTYWEKITMPDPLVFCEYKCEWSTNKSFIGSSDAVVFHLYNNQHMKDFVMRNLPKRHNIDQKWILMIREPQSFFYPDQIKLLNNIFNLTMTFQLDSDVVIPYGEYHRHSSPSLANQAIEEMESILASKRKLVAWLVSNCVTSSRRESYVTELKKYIPVDVYGACAEQDTTNKSTPLQGPGLPATLSTQYMFYLAFENADCDDYITEKFWRYLYLGMIPIVRGHRARYKKLAPPNSYIHADSFVSAERLALHLEKVAQNPALYRKYHLWRVNYSVYSELFTSNRKWMCDLCERVHNAPRKTVDIYEHFSEDKRCFTYLEKSRNRSAEHVEDIDRV